MTAKIYNPCNSFSEPQSFVAGEDAAPTGGIPRESAVDVQAASAQVVTDPPVKLSPHNRHVIRNARRRWRFLNGNGEFCARETGEKFLRPVGEYDPKSRERWGKSALAPDPMSDEVVARERTNLRRDLASERPERRDAVLGSIYSWLAIYMEMPKSELDRLERQARGEAVSELDGGE
jgi:hypothetical protein